MAETLIDEPARLAALIEAEGRALALLDAIEAAGLVAPGRSERAIEQDIRWLAERDFGVTKHWHKRVVRAGINTLTIASDTPPDRTVAADDIVFLDLGPVFAEWEADVGRSYAVGPDPQKHALCADLPVIFEKLRAEFHAVPDITGAQLYAQAHALAEEAGWLFGGKIAGHIVGEFPHAHIRGGKDMHRINAANETRLRDPDPDGRVRHWIIEVHLLAPDRSFGGFYERLCL